MCRPSIADHTTRLITQKLCRETECGRTLAIELAKNQKTIEERTVLIKEEEN